MPEPTVSQMINGVETSAGLTTTKQTPAKIIEINPPHKLKVSESYLRDAAILKAKLLNPAKIIPISAARNQTSILVPSIAPPGNLHHA